MTLFMHGIDDADLPQGPRRQTLEEILENIQMNLAKISLSLHDLLNDIAESLRVLASRPH